jgi:hypothetical protein
MSIVGQGNLGHTAAKNACREEENHQHAEYFTDVATL